MGEAVSPGSSLKLRIHHRFGLLPGLGLHHLLGPMPDPGSAQAAGSSPPTPAGARPILNARSHAGPCPVHYVVERLCPASLTAFFSLTAHRRCRACSVLTGHPSEECVPTGFLMPPAPGSATPVTTIFGMLGEGERDDRRIDRVLSGFGS